MLKAVVFDMDDTLLSINLSAFCAVWGRDVTGILGSIGRMNQLMTAARLGGVLYNLNANGRSGTDNRCNREFFNAEVLRTCHVDLRDPVAFEALDYYERAVLPYKNDSVINARPREGAQEAIETVLDRGLRIALFTNPSFSESGIRCRMGWGGLLDVPFELVTTMENCTRVKPDPVYYLENLERMGLEPHEVLMVGNDPKRDFPLPDCGIQTAYVGVGKPRRALWSGDMCDLAASFDEIIERFEERAVVLGGER